MNMIQVINARLFERLALWLIFSGQWAWEKGGYSNTPLGLIHNVNFKVLNVNYKIDQKYKNLIDEKKIDQSEIQDLMDKYNNVVKEMSIEWLVIKD